MLENIYALYDRESGITLKPLLIDRNDVAPVRQITDLANNKDSIINKHAKDFQLVHIGTIDIETLAITAVARRVVANAADLQTNGNNNA